MSAVDLALPRLASEEGFRGSPYKDSEGHTTVGYGFNVDAGISRGVATTLLLAQVEELDSALHVYVWYAELDPVRQSVCIDIAFNSGISGLLHFPNMIAALARKDWANAALECKVKNPELAGRYIRLAQILLTGVNT